MPADSPSAEESSTRCAGDTPAAVTEPLEQMKAVSSQALPVVGLGGSAGSIQALQTFFSKVPAEAGAAFVVVVHLSPDVESSLPEILGRCTHMPVKAAADNDVLKAGHVYVIPPGVFLKSMDGRLKLEPLEPARGRRVAVDLFFRTLADTHGRRAAAVVLSGADGDGAIGVKRMKERGGVTVCQDPAEALHPEMPSTAIGTGMVDWVLPVAEIGPRLVQYFRQGRRLGEPAAEDPTEEDLPKQPPEPVDEEGVVREIMLFVKNRTGRDFADYKRATVLRRITRRMHVNGMESMREYLDFLRTHGGESGALLQDLLISVTNFFRDPEAFQALEKEIPRLFRGKTSQDAVRVWVPACATGEEAYSIAILLLEHAATMEVAPTLQVFGCDLDDTAIRTARTGLYPHAIEADVSDDRLRRYFIKEAQGYRVRREVREMVLFATHDLLRDAPFSRMDLISCRNLLIYLNAATQSRLFDLFAFALYPGALLFLGTAENIDEEEGLFEAVDKKARLFLNRGHRRMGLPSSLVPPAIPVLTELRPDPPILLRQTSLLPVPPPAAAGRVQEPQAVHLALIERLAPPSLVINGELEVIHFSQGAGKYLVIPGGEPTRHVLQLAHPLLRAELRAIIYRAREEGTSETAGGIPFSGGDGPHSLTLRVSPAPDVAPGCMLIVFEAATAMGSGEAVAPSERHEAVVRYLEREIEGLKNTLRQTVENYETSTEELKANNEELQAMNEELRSATEELETSREELRSINEELTTVNQELRTNLDHLARANGDLTNLMASTDIATVFLDRQLRIMRYTPTAVALFRLIPGDIGRPLSDLRHQLQYSEMASDVATVLAQLAPMEREVADHDGRWFLARVLPYRTPEDFIGGVVLTLVEITQRRLAEQALAENGERLRLVIDSAREHAIISMDLDRRITGWNPGAEKIFGWRETEMLGKTADCIFTPEDRNAGVPAREAQTALNHGRASDERWHLRGGGERFWANGSLMAMKDRQGAALGLVKILADQTANREAMEALNRSQQESVSALEETRRAHQAAEAAAMAKDQFLASLSHELRTPLNPALMAVAALEEDAGLPADVRTQLTTIRRNVELEARLIDDLLDVTRISRGCLKVRMQPCDVHHLLDEAAAIVAGDPEMGGATPIFEKAATNPWVSGEPARLQQIFWNLLKNAFKFSSPTARVVVRTDNPSPEWFAVQVHDQGIGISQEGLTRVFRPFDQGDLAGQHRFGGLGLGLSICKALAELHGGSLTAASDGPGKGATFTLTLRTLPPDRLHPASVEAAPALASASPSGTAGPADRSGTVTPRARRILLVEDHADSLAALARLLRREGHSVHMVTTVEDAFQAAMRHTFDLVISDLCLPDGSGYTLMREIRHRYGWPGIALSGCGMKKDLEDSAAAGFSSHLVKPITMPALREAIVKATAV